MVSFYSSGRRSNTKEGGDRMSDYEMIMVILTILTLVVGLLKSLIDKDRK